MNGDGSGGLNSSKVDYQPMMNQMADRMVRMKPMEQANDTS